MMGGGSDAHGQGGAYGGGGLQGGYGSGGGVNAGGGANSGGQGTFGGSRGGGYENSAGYGDQTSAQNEADALALAAASYQTFGQKMFGGWVGEVADKIMGSVPVVGQVMSLANMLGQMGYKTGEAPAQQQQGIGGGYGGGGGFGQVLSDMQQQYGTQNQTPMFGGYGGASPYLQQTQNTANPLVLPSALQGKTAQQDQLTKTNYNLF